jgi:hypothetical protein
LTAVPRVGLVASRRVPRVGPAHIKGRVAQDSSPLDHARSTQRVLDLQATQVLAPLADARALARVLDSVVRAPEASALRVVRFLRLAKLRVLRVLPVRRRAVAASSIPRPKKAR